MNKQNIVVAIRPWSDADLPLEERLMGDPAMTRYLGGPESLEKIRERHERYCRIGDTGKGRMFVIVAGPDRVAAGSVGYWEREQRGQLVWETGWSVLPEFQGRGIATQAIAAMMEQARNEGKHRFLHAFPSVDNGPSNAVCRKAGFTLQEEAEFEYPPGNFIRCNDWSLDLFPDKTTDPRTTYDAVSADITATSPATTGQMFGKPCLKNNGKVFAAFINDTMAFKLTGPAHAEALALPGARLSDPSGKGRPMKEWVEVPVEHAERWPEFGRDALNYVSEGK